MTSSRFVSTAKYEATSKLQELFKATINQEELEVVWQTHVLGNKKCILFAPKLPGVLIEATYRDNKTDVGQLYIDVYTKLANDTITV